MQNKTIDQLNKKYKTLKSGTAALAGIFIVLFIATIHSSVMQKTFDLLFAMALNSQL